MAKARRGSVRKSGASVASGEPSATPGESGGFIGQLGLAETGGTSPGLVGIALAFLLALAVYPIGWLVRRLRHRD